MRYDELCVLRWYPLIVADMRKDVWNGGVMMGVVRAGVAGYYGEHSADARAGGQTQSG